MTISLCDERLAGESDLCLQTFGFDFKPTFNEVVVFVDLLRPVIPFPATDAGLQTEYEMQYENIHLRTTIPSLRMNAFQREARMASVNASRQISFEAHDNTMARHSDAALS